MHRLVIVLIQPQLPENIGAVARAMANFTLTELRLVTPHCSPNDPKALATSAGAETILLESQIFPDFESAIDDLEMIVGTCADYRHMIKPSWPLGYAVKEIRQQGTKTGIIFGPERTGLSNEILARCHAIIQIPTNPNFSSLNLAQAVLLLAYEWYQCQIQPQPRLQTGETQPATQGEIKQWLSFLEMHLDQVNFWRQSSKKPIMWRNLMNVFTRNQLTSQEIRTLYGMIESLTRVKSPRIDPKE